MNTIQPAYAYKNYCIYSSNQLSKFLLSIGEGGAVVLSGGVPPLGSLLP